MKASRFVAAAVVMLIPAVARAELDARKDFVTRGKQATALVIVEQRRGFGTAFCIDSTGFFITNHHVVERSGDEVELVVNAGQSTQRVVRARVVRVDKEQDFALLQADPKELGDSAASLALGDDAGLIETAEVTAFGYPFGTLLALKKQDFPNITISVGRVSSLRKSDGILQGIQLDAEINPGNSGGPVVDKNGKVVGVIQAKVRGTRVNLAIPVSKLRAFLTRPEVTLIVPPIQFPERHDKIKIEARVAAFDGAKRAFSAYLNWSSSDLDKRRIPFDTKDGQVFHATLVPVPKSERQNERHLTAEFATGSVRCLVAADTFQLDEKEIKLGEVRDIERRENGYLIHLDNGSQLTGKALRKFPTQADFGDYRLEVDFSKAQRLKISDVPSGTEVIKYTLVVEEMEREVARIDGVVPIIKKRDKQNLAEFLALGGKAAWPAFLKASDTATYDKDGLRVRDRSYVLTKSSTFLNQDFTFEIEFKFSQQSKTLICIGFGEVNRGPYREPKDTVYLRIHSPNLSGGGVGVSKHPVSTHFAAGRLRTFGPHLAKIEKRGKSVTFHIDVDHDGPSPDDMTRTIPDITEFAPFLHEKNTHLFFGGDSGGLFTKVRLTGE